MHYYVLYGQLRLVEFGNDLYLKSPDNYLRPLRESSGLAFASNKATEALVTALEEANFSNPEIGKTP